MQEDDGQSEPLICTQSVIDNYKVEVEMVRKKVFHLKCALNLWRDCKPVNLLKQQEHTKAKTKSKVLKPNK